MRLPFYILGLCCCSFFANSQVNPTDSLALVSIYTQCNGTNWTISWDFHQPVNTWSNVVIDNNLNRVVELDLHNVGLTNTLPNELGDLNQLKKLTLSKNQITGLPMSVGALTQLKELDLYNNILFNLPSTIGNLNLLEALRLESNPINALPSSIGNLVNLELLMLSNTSIATVPNNFDNLLSLKYLYIANTNLSTFPDEIYSLINLKKLYCGYSNISYISNDIKYLVQLEELYLHHCNLTTLPHELGQLPALQTLQLNNNQLTTLPASLGNLSTLLNFNLDNNLLTELPTTIGQLNQLSLLSVNNNLLDSIPSTFVGLSQLVRLSAEKNKLTKLPAGMAAINPAPSIFVSFNQLEFDDLEPFMQLPSGNFIYHSQDSVGQSRTVMVPFTSSYTLSADVGGSQNNYQWFKDNTPIPNATNQNYVITNFQSNDIGNYHCEVTSAIVPNLVIATRPIQLISAIISNNNTLNADYSTRIYMQLASKLAHIQSQWETPQTGFYGLYTINGQQLQQVRFQNAQTLSKTIDLSNYPAGTYIVVVETEAGMTSQKITRP